MGLHGDAGVVSTYVVTVLPALFWIAVEDPNCSWRRVGWLLIALVLFIAAITEQRAAWLALAVQIAVIAALLARAGRIPLSRRQVVVAGSLVLVTAVGAILSYSFYRHGNAGALPADSRMAFWPSVLTMIGTHPLAGAGFGRQSMKIAYPQLIPGYNPELWHAHNLVLNYGLALGLPGVVALLALFAAWGRFFWRCAGTAAGIAGCALVAGVLVRNQFNDFFQRDMSLLFWALCGLFAGMCLARREES
jgi:O-antigen ligase